MTVLYSVWKDERTGDYEVVRWSNRAHVVVQTNIRTWEKAALALKVWQKREEERSCRK